LYRWCQALAVTPLGLSSPGSLCKCHLFREALLVGFVLPRTLFPSGAYGNVTSSRSLSRVPSEG
ncbi:hypothetical protein STEG23_015543, partial [Scotinomys teguina]